MTEARYCDVLIVGSGLVGCTFAKLLHDAGADVLMVDAGAFQSRRAGENHKNAWFNQRDLIRYGHFVQSQLRPVTSVDDADYPAGQVCYAIGGMAAHWTCAVPFFHRSERPDFISDAEWERLNARAGALLNRHEDVFAGSSRQKAIEHALAEKGWTVLPTPMAALRRPGSAYPIYSGADTILDGLAEPRAHERFAILPEHCVRRLVRASGSDHRIEYAEIVDLQSGEMLHVHAGQFVVAAGWLLTAQILWASGIHRHEESALGRYFTEHSFAACTITLDPAVISDFDENDAPPHLYLPVTDERPWQGMIFRESYQFEAPPEERSAQQGIDLKWFGMIQPRRENRVTFTDRRSDRFGMPAAIFRIRPGEDDIRIREAMMEDMRQVATALGPFVRGKEPFFPPMGAAIHATGLTRIGPEDDAGATSVADPWSRVWGLDNVYVGGTCAIPTPTAANPTLTAIALAIRATEKTVGT